MSSFEQPRFRSPLNSSQTGEERTRYGLGLIAALTVLVGVVLFYNLGGCRTLGSHEIFAVVPAREMLRSGNWILPQFGGVPRLEKPPLGYWVIALFAKGFGGLTATTARLPAALSALLLATLTGIWAGRWYGRTAGLAAAVVQATSMYVIIYGRKTEVDMLLCLLTTAALFLIAHQDPAESSRRSFFRWLGVYALLSLSWLAKFHYGVVMVLGPAVLYFMMQRKTSMLRYLLHPLGLGVLAAGVFIWPHLVLNQTPQAATIWQQETVGRAVGDQGRDPFWFYLPYLVLLTLPWTPFALASVPTSWRRAWAGTRTAWRQSGSPRKFFKHFAAAGDDRERFLWVWFLTDLAMLTLSANKHKHYLFAVLPIASLLAGQTMARWAALFKRNGATFRRHAQFGRYTPFGRYTTAGLMFGVLAASWSSFVLLTNRWPHLQAAALVTAGLMVIGGCAAVWLLKTGRSMAAVYTVIALFVGCDLVVMGWILPGRDRGRAIVQFADTVRQKVPSGRDVYVYRMGKNPIVYYLNGSVHRLEAKSALDRQLHASGHLYVIASINYVAELSKSGRLRTLQFVKPIDGLGLPNHFRMVLAELTAPPRYAALRRAAPRYAPPRYAARRTGTVAGDPSSKRENTTAAF